jgi:hypothetical protein
LVVVVVGAAVVVVGLTQRPWLQVWPAAQACPQAPQLCTSVARLTQVLLPQQFGVALGQQIAPAVWVRQTSGCLWRAAGPQVWQSPRPWAASLLQRPRSAPGGNVSLQKRAH